MIFFGGLTYNFRSETDMRHCVCLVSFKTWSNLVENDNVCIFRKRFLARNNTYDMSTFWKWMLNTNREYFRFFPQSIEKNNNKLTVVILIKYNI